MALTKTPIELSSTPGIVDNSNATAITIDSSENVLVGKSAVNFATAGAEIMGHGEIQVTRASGVPMYLRRNSSNGAILSFYKDGTAVGNISVVSDDRMVFATADGLGLQFDKDNNRIIPCDATGGTNSNVSLGSSGLEFKDLYLSGGAYLGGTAAANKLEDYETGVWTPVDQNGNAYTPNVQASYTKIGRLVYFNFDISSTAVTTGPFVYGLPFPALAASVSGNWSLYTGYSTSNTDITGHINASSSKISIYVGSTAHTLSGRWMGAGSYYAA